jgi:glucuronokinase
VLGVEQEELRITAGLQDRVIQVYEGMVYMDFARDRRHLVDDIPCYHYEPLDPTLLPQLYVAYHDELSEPTEVFHNDIRERFDRGEAAVVSAMERFASLAARGRDALLAGDTATLGRLIDENFDTRRGIYRLPDWQIAMVEASRRAGATAKFAGSGGAIVGTYPDEATLSRVAAALAALGSKTISPVVRDENTAPPPPTNA